MKLLVALSFLSLCAFAADIPKTAVQTAPGVYSYKDAQGQKWIYRSTPFGVVRMEDRPAAPATAAVKPNIEGIKAVDAGDSIRFERPGPFGMYRWQTKKSELTDSERAAWEQSRKKKD